jgi:hypothetical protein
MPGCFRPCRALSGTLLRNPWRAPPWPTPRPAGAPGSLIARSTVDGLHVVLLLPFSSDRRDCCSSHHSGWAHSVVERTGSGSTVHRGNLPVERTAASVIDSRPLRTTSGWSATVASRPARMERASNVLLADKIGVIYRARSSLRRDRRLLARPGGGAGTRGRAPHLPAFRWVSQIFWPVAVMRWKRHDVSHMRGREVDRLSHGPSHR